MAALGSDVPGYVPGGRNVMADHYVVSPGNPPFPDKAHFIGLLTGNWWQMGWEAGRRAGDSIRVTGNVMWEEITRKCGIGKAPAEIKRYEAQLRASCL